jgi:hypothetical protein
MYSTPPLWHAAHLVGLIGREAPVMAVSPLQNFLNPPPVPDTPMVTRAELTLELFRRASADRKRPCSSRRS